MQTIKGTMLTKSAIFNHGIFRWTWWNFSQSWELTEDGAVMQYRVKQLERPTCYCLPTDQCIEGEQGRGRKIMHQNVILVMSYSPSVHSEAVNAWTLEETPLVHGTIGRWWRKPLLAFNAWTLEQTYTPCPWYKWGGGRKPFWSFCCNVICCIRTTLHLIVNLRGSFVLKISVVECRSILLSDTLDRHFNQYLIYIPINTRSTLNWHLINSQSIVGRVLNDSYSSIGN